MTRESDLSRLIRRKNRREKKKRGLTDKGRENRETRLDRERAKRFKDLGEGKWPGAFMYSDSPMPTAERYLPRKTRPSDPAGALGDWGIRPENLMAPYTYPGKTEQEGTLVLPRGIESEGFIDQPLAFPDIWKTALQKEFAAQGQAPSERRLFDPMGPERLGPAEAPPLGHLTGSVDREGMISPRIALQKEWMTQPLREDQFSPQDPTYREQPYQREKSLLWNSNLGKYQTAKEFWSTEIEKYPNIKKVLGSDLLERVVGLRHPDREGSRAFTQPKENMKWEYKGLKPKTAKELQDTKFQITSPAHRAVDKKRREKDRRRRFKKVLQKDSDRRAT